MILSGDDLTHIGADRLDVLRKLLPPAGMGVRAAGEVTLTVPARGGRVVICTPEA